MYFNFSILRKLCSILRGEAFVQTAQLFVSGHIHSGCFAHMLHSKIQYTCAIHKRMENPYSEKYSQLHKKRG